MYSCAQACDSKKATSEKSPFYSCLFSKVTLFILLGVGAIWGRALLILHSKLMNVRSGVSALLSKRELGKANSLLGRARGLVK
jgi:hypothetical protein